MELFEKNAKARIELLRDQFEQTQQPDRIEFTQGSIVELRRLLTLRHEVIEGTK